jgi:hypothetical protein
MTQTAKRGGGYPPLPTNPRPWRVTKPADNHQIEDADGKVVARAVRINNAHLIVEAVNAYKN